jgi:hypothetical protein
MNGLKRSGANLTLLTVAIATATIASNVAAAPIDVGNPDIQLRWDTSVRYNLGFRAQKQEKALSYSATQQISDNKFDRGDVVANRLDLLSEVDFIYKEKYGARVSAAGWYDHAYRDDDAEGLAQWDAVGYPNAYPGGNYTSKVERYYRGPSGEILDAFVFGGFDVGEVPVRMKAGRHNLYWGESLFSFVHGVSYAQGPVDIRKATATPGTEAKELFLPLNQLSVQSQLTDTLTVAGYYQFEWDPSRLPEGGTYFGTADFVYSGGTVFPTGAPFVGDVDKPKNQGSWGGMLKWRAEALDSTLGFYYREFSDTLPNLVSVDNYYGLKYAENVKLYGVSLSKQVGSASVGAELLRRENTALVSVAGMPDYARGDTWHALVNTILAFGSTPLWDTSVLQAELTYSRLDKVTKNSMAYSEKGNPLCASERGGKGDAEDGCATRDALGLQMSFTPTWYQALDGVDVTLPMTYGVGLYGSSPVSNGGNEGAGNYSVGVGLDYEARHQLTLAYNGFFGPITTSYNPVVGTNTVATSSGATPLLRDRGWVSLTFKTTF